MDLVDVIARSHTRGPHMAKATRRTATSSVEEQNCIIRRSDVSGLTKARGVAVDSSGGSFNRDEARHVNPPVRSV